jgi:hypothetical protein
MSGSKSTRLVFQYIVRGASGTNWMATLCDASPNLSSLGPSHSSCQSRCRSNRNVPFPYWFVRCHPVSITSLVPNGGLMDRAIVDFLADVFNDRRRCRFGLNDPCIFPSPELKATYTSETLERIHCTSPCFYWLVLVWILCCMPSFVQSECLITRLARRMTLCWQRWLVFPIDFHICATLPPSIVDIILVQPDGGNTVSTISWPLR